MRTLLLVTVSVLGALAGCRKDAGPSASAGSTELKMAMFPPASIDPGLVRDQPGRVLVENLFEGLLMRDAAGKPVAGAASAWTTSPDQLTWTFTLRPDLTWSDGVKLTAEDFLWSMRRALAPETANPQAEMLWPIKNARPLSEGKLAAGQELGVAAPKPDTLVITLERPYPLLPRLLATAYTMPAPRHVVEKHGKDWTRAEHIVSNGAYVLATHQNEQTMTLRKNARFHDATSVAIETVSMRFTTSLDDARKWYELGEVDWAENLVAPTVVKELRGKPDLRIDDYDGVSYMFANTSKPPFDDARVRRALDLALDRDRLVRQVLEGGEKPAVSPIPPGLTTARPKPRVRFDPTKAKALLAEAGYGPDKPFPKVELAFNPNERNKMLSEFYQRNLRETLGVDVTLNVMEWKSFLARLESKDYELGLLQLVGGLDALEYVDMMKSGSAQNYPHYANADYDAIVERVRTAKTLGERDTALEDALTHIEREMPLISVFNLTAKALVRPTIEGYEANAENLHPIRWLRFR